MFLSFFVVVPFCICLNSYLFLPVFVFLNLNKEQTKRTITFIQPFSCPFLICRQMFFFFFILQFSYEQKLSEVLH